MKKTFTISLVILLGIILGFTFMKSESQPCLCEKGEENLYSFRTIPSHKIMSLCIGADRAYLQYRYGLPGEIELNYPEKRDASSWNKFTYEGYERGGGAANAAQDLQSISFTNDRVTYTVFSNSGYEDETDESFHKDIGIEVEISGETKSTTINADPKTESGYLGRLNQMGEIKNKFGY